MISRDVIVHSITVLCFNLTSQIRFITIGNGIKNEGQNYVEARIISLFEHRDIEAFVVGFCILIEYMKYMKYIIILF